LPATHTYRRRRRRSRLTVPLICNQGSFWIASGFESSTPLPDFFHTRGKLALCQHVYRCFTRCLHLVLIKLRNSALSFSLLHPDCVGFEVVHLPARFLRPPGQELLSARFMAHLELWVPFITWNIEIVHIIARFLRASGNETMSACLLLSEPLVKVTSLCQLLLYRLTTPMIYRNTRVSYIHIHIVHAISISSPTALPTVTRPSPTWPRRSASLPPNTPNTPSPPL
jgi:hypothetical protein